MQVVFHTGSHCTSEDLLMKSLLQNKDAFAKLGIALPGPGRYRELLKQTCRALDYNKPSDDARDVLLDAILDEEVADRVLLSSAPILASRNYTLSEGQLYPNAGLRISQLQQLFKYDQLEVFMAIRNPATFLPEVMAKVPPELKAQALAETDLTELKWSDTITQIRHHAPDVPVTVWCYEDAPLIWAEIIREMAGLNPGEKIKGGFALLSEIMTKEGMKRFRTYLHEKPEMPEVQKRRVMAAFLDKFAIDDMVEDELDLDGWTEELVDEMTERYEEDTYVIQQMPGVNLIAP
jgi:hypothetical protein